NRASTQPAIGVPGEPATADPGCAPCGPPLTGLPDAWVTVAAEFSAEDGLLPFEGTSPARSTSSQSSFLGFCSSADAPFGSVEFSSPACGASATVRDKTTTG